MPIVLIEIFTLKQLRILLKATLKIKGTILKAEYPEMYWQLCVWNIYSTKLINYHLTAINTICVIKIPQCVKAVTWRFSFKRLSSKMHVWNINPDRAVKLDII